MSPSGVERDPSLIIVVSGLPASGKSTVGRFLARALGHPLLDKDDILESLFPPDRIANPVERSRLSRQADGILRASAEEHSSLVAVSHWRHPGHELESGTPIEWFDRFGTVVEVHCSCAPEVAAARFLGRERHPSHGDDLKEPETVRAQFRDLASLGPLGVTDHLVEIDTAGHTDMRALVTEVERISRAAST